VINRSLLATAVIIALSVIAFIPPEKYKSEGKWKRISKLPLAL
jgi:hypothetical protein